MWKKTKPNEWTNDQGKRITQIKDVFYVYLNGDYLGFNKTLEEAKARELKSKDCIKDQLPLGVPAFLNLTNEERKAEWANVTVQPTWRMSMAKTSSQYDGMASDALLRAYNENVEIARSKGLDHYKPMVQFSDRESAIKHLDSIDSSIRAAVEASKAELTGKRKREPTKAELRVEGTKAVKAFTKKKKAEEKEAKAAAKATVKEETKTPPPRKGGKSASATGNFIEDVGVREGTNKEKLASLLIKNVNKSLTMTEVCKHVYGKSDNPAIVNVIGGLINNIKEKKLNYQIKREKDRIGLYASK